MFSAALLLLALWLLGIFGVYSIGAFDNVFLLLGSIFFVLALRENGVISRRSVVTLPRHER